MYIVYIGTFLHHLWPVDGKLPQNTDGMLQFPKLQLRYWQALQYNIETQCHVLIVLLRHAFFKRGAVGCQEHLIVHPVGNVKTSIVAQYKPAAEKHQVGSIIKI